jgi:hypothetical protein
MPMLKQPTLPVYSPMPLVRFPIHFRADLSLNSSILFGSPPVATAESAIMVLAPFNDYLGTVWKQANATGIPDAVTVPTNFGLTDPYITSLLTPVTTSTSTNASMVRWSKFCVQVINLDPLSTVQSSVQALCWLQQGFPLGAANSAPNYYSMYTTLAEASTGNGMKTHEISSAKLTGGKCFTTGMIERSAVELTPASLGSGAWNNIYGNSSGSGAIVGNGGSPWAPIVMAFTIPPPSTPPGVVVAGTGASSSLRFRIIVEAVMEMAPAPNNFLYRMAQTPAVTPASAETAWFSHQRTLLKEGWIDLGDHFQPGMRRSVGGYIGV